MRLPATLMTVAILAAACLGGSVEQHVDVSAHPGGRVVHGVFTDARTLLPTLTSDVVSTRATQLVYAPLWRANPVSGEIVPNLGRWNVSADGLTYSWQIDESARWSDGIQVVGEDYLTAVKAVARSKKTVRKSSFQDIEGFAAYRDGKATTITGISAEGKRFSVRFARATCVALVNAFGHAAGPLPTHVFGKYTIDEDPTKNVDDAPEALAPPISSGPFLFKEWRRGDQLVFVRNPGYFRGRALLDEYVFKIVADTAVVASQLRTGELTLAAIEPSDLATIEREPQLRVLRYSGLRYTYIGWNLRRPSTPLQDRRVRQALTRGLDMDTFVREVLLGEAERAVTHHARSSWAFPSSALDPYPFDRAAAARLIEEAGYRRGADGIYVRDGAPLELTIVSHTGIKAREALLAVAAEQYTQLGVRVRQRLETVERLNDELARGIGEFDGWINGWVLSGDPDPYGIWHSSQIPDPVQGKTGFNFGGFTAPGLDQAIERGRAGDCTLTARKAAYDEFGRILNSEQPYNFGFSPRTLVAVERKLRGFEPGPFDEMPQVERWWLAG